MDVYGGIYRAVLMPGWERLRGRPMFERLRYLERSQWEPASSVRALQLMELRRLLVHAGRRIPYYREVFATAGFDPRRLAALDDLAKLPLLSKEIIRARYRDLVDPDTAPTHIRKQTSGSSGQPFAFEYDRDSEVWRQAVKWRTYRWGGYRPGMRCFYYWGMPLPLRGTHGAKVRLDRALRRERYVDCLVQNDAALSRAADALRRFRPEVVVGYSIALATLARFITDRGLRDWDRIAVIGSSEPLYEEDRAALVAAFGDGVFDTYGTRETMLLAAECDAHAGLHTMDDAQIVEVLVDGRPARPGETGEIVVTDLHNFGMPLVRYKNGDLARTTDGAPCPCGRGLARAIERVTGRQTEQLRDAQGRPVSGMLMAALLANMRHRVRELQAVQRAAGELVIRVVPGPAYDAPAMAEMAAVARRYLGGAVSIETTAHIDRGPGGKHRLVVVEPPSPQADEHRVAAI
jgi:phenylacetate-CoA ligase